MLKTAYPKVDLRLVLNQNIPRKAKMDHPMQHHLRVKRQEEVVTAIAADNGHLNKAIASLMKKSCLTGRFISPTTDEDFEGADFLAVLHKTA
jgi:hypothetical protein